MLAAAADDFFDIKASQEKMENLAQLVKEYVSLSHNFFMRQWRWILKEKKMSMWIIKMPGLLNKIIA